MTSIYVHIPFCHSKCIYCDFYSLPGLRRAGEVADGIVAEYTARRGELPGPPSTVYFGGGTPSSLPVEILERIVEGLPLESVTEFTIEANPEDIDAVKVDAWRRMGVNRVSMGIQTLDDDALRRMGRRHSAAQAMEAVDIIHGAGIDNISVDMIYGLPGLTPERWQEDLRRVLALAVDHLSAYCLTYNEGTMLYRQMQQGKVTPADDDTIAAQYEILCRESAGVGFEHYEISNFARPGRRSRHNAAYWNPDSQWLGLGPSAHSFDGTVRRIDIADTGRWLESLPRPFEIDEETPLDRINDTIVTSLRTLEGLDLCRLPGDIAQGVMADAARFVESGHMQFDGRRLSIPPARWLTADAYIRELIRV